MKEMLSGGSTMGLSHIATLQLPDQSKKIQTNLHLPKIENIPTDIIGRSYVIMDASSHKTSKKLQSKKWTIDNKMHQEQTNINMVSSPVDTTTKNYGK